jgi:ABC-type glycerol-3-phosphate transport system permease component
MGNIFPLYREKEGVETMAALNPSRHSAGSEQSGWPIKHLLGQGLAYVLLAIIAFLSLYPLALMVINSFKSDNDVLLNAAGLPNPWTLSSYARLIEFGQLQNFLNSLFVAAVATFISVFLAALAAFAFTKLHFPGRNVIFFVLLATIMVPGEITIPPLYLVFAQVNWIDTYQVQIIPFIAPVFGLFMMRQYMTSIPDSFIEAARLDGANEWQIFWRIMVPVSAPILSSFAILQFLGTWNSFLWPQVMANNAGVAPLSVTLPTLADPVMGIVPIYGTIMAGSVLATVPLVIIFLCFQDKFISGVTFGAAKE